MAAVRSRARSTQDSSTRDTLQVREFLFRRAAKASFSALIIGQCLKKFDPSEIRPECFCHVDFRICHLPQKEVAQTKLTAVRISRSGSGIPVVQRCWVKMSSSTSCGKSRSSWTAVAIARAAATISSRLP